jgi:hypothetical protein
MEPVVFFYMTLAIRKGQNGKRGRVERQRGVTSRSQQNPEAQDLSGD